MNRFHHLKRTLVPNLAKIICFGSDVEWVIVNYNSQDEMDDGLRDYISFTMRGHLAYYRTTDIQYFNYSHAKNLSHLLARSDYVVSLDADNFLDAGGIARILQLFAEYPDAILKGLGGLVGLKKPHFLSLGGYDEDFHGWGYEENDFVMRATRWGLTPVGLDCVKDRIEHSDEERIENFDPALLEEFEAKDPATIRMEMNERNGRMATAKSQGGKIRANENRMLGRARVTKNFSDETFEVGWMTGQER